MLTLQQLSEIGKELIGSLDSVKNANDSTVQIQKDREEQYKKYVNFKLFYDKFNDTITQYETERRWLDGTTYTAIPYSQIEEAAKRSAGNAHYSGSWDKLAPQITTNINGNPQTNSGSNENIVLNDTFVNKGLLALLSFITTGQSSGVASNSLDTAYSPGAPDIELVSGTQTVGKYLFISGSGTSAMVLVTNAVTTTITITEIIPPTGTIAIGGSVVENIPAFTNTELNFLTSTLYQNILTNLTNFVITAVANWKTAVTNQLAQLNLNTDPNATAEITAAKTAANTALTAINVWQALPNTGTTGLDSKFTANNLANLATAYGARNTFRPTRVNQITGALGSATQDGEGKIGGTGLYSQRFKSISLMINTVDGPWYLYFIKLKLIDTNKQTVQNEQGKQELFGTSVRSAAFTANGTGSNTVSVRSSSGFSIGNTVLVLANALDDIQATITGISGNNITLSKPIPNSFTLLLKATIVKAI